MQATLQQQFIQMELSKILQMNSTWSVATNADKAQVDATKKGRFLGTSSGQAKVNAKLNLLLEMQI
jgi:hypothetical protein